jgi:hypothetical protein
MKTCTACSTKYSDDTLSFCPVDGTTLTPEKQISYEQVPFSYEPGSWSGAEIPPPPSENPNYISNFGPPPAANSFSLPPPLPVPQNISSTGPRRNSNHRLLFPAVAVGAVLLAAVVVLLMATGSDNSGTGSYPVAARANSNVTVRVANTTVVNSAPAPAKSAPANTSALSNTGKPISRKIDFTGIWKGKFNNVPATLSITTQQGDVFSGTLSKNGYVIELSGKINFEKGTVAITETAVLQTPANSKWNLGTDDGTISEDGKSMSGTGKDKNGSYPWSFIKD